MTLQVKEIEFAPGDANLRGLRRERPDVPTVRAGEPRGG